MPYVFNKIQGFSRGLTEPAAVTGNGPLRALYLLYSHYASDPRPRRQAEDLRDAGWKDTVLSLGNPEEVKPFTIDGVDIVPFRMSRYRGTKAGGYLRGYLRFLAWATAKVVRQANRYDLVHIHTPPDFLAFASPKGSQASPETFTTRDFPLSASSAYPPAKST